ncbi:MAG: IS66 family transposase [Candidatus Azotimanducaceae bacterium WSBS_2022_MAG_OTU7]
MINADETPLNVIREDKHQCYRWVYCTGTDSPLDNRFNTHPLNIVLFEDQTSREGIVLKTNCPKD